MIGYGSWELPFTLFIEPCKVIDPTDGSVTTDSQCRRNAQGKIMIYLRFNLDTGLGELAIHSSDLADCTAGTPPDHYTAEIMCYIGSIEDREIHPDPPLILTRTDLEVDFKKDWSWDMGYMGLAYFTNCPLLWKYNLSLSSKPPEKTKVNIAGCANIMIGVSASLTATVDPEGEGTYTWSCDPPDIFDVSGSGSSATATGKNAGRATIKVEYQPKRGKKVEATLPGSVVELLSVNGGADIPQIGLYDENGEKKPAVQIPTEQDPPEGSLLNFPVTNPAIALVDNLGVGLMIQGKQEGVTTAQGQTICGDQDEHLITIEVVNCDEETKRKLQEKIDDLKKQKDENLEEIKRISSDPEFVRAKSELDRHLTSMGVKATKILLGSLTGGEYSTLDKIADVLLELQNVTEEGTWTGNWSLLDMYIKTQVNFVKQMTIGIIGDLIEYGEAGLEVGHDLDVIKATCEKLKEPARKQQELQKQYDEANRRQVEICKDFGGKPKPPEPKPPEPQPPQPEPPKPKPPSPKPGEPSESPEPEPPKPGDEEIPPIEPPPPPPPTQTTGGFPIECSCESWDIQQWSNKPKGLENISQDIGGFVSCLDQFLQNTVDPLESTATATEQLFEQLEQALLLPDSQKIQTYQNALPAMIELRDKNIMLGTEFRSMNDSLNKCGSTLQNAGETIEITGAGMK